MTREGTHEAVQEEFPELGAEVVKKTPKARKSGKKCQPRANCPSAHSTGAKTKSKSGKSAKKYTKGPKKSAKKSSKAVKKVKTKAPKKVAKGEGAEAQEGPSEEGPRARGARDHEGA